MPKYAPPRSGQDLNPFMTGSPLTMPHYANTNSPTYNYTLQPRHGEYSPLYSAYATTFISSQTEELQCLSKHLQMTPQYPYNTSILGSTASPHRPLAQATPCSIQQLSSHPFSQGLRYSNHHDLFQLPEVESQDSVNESTMRSEPVLPPLSGFPDVRDFDRLVNSYVDSLSSKKQDKALINAKRARNIRAVLIDKKITTVESAQFRFWVKKMFTLGSNESTHSNSKSICHEGKPIAIREKLFKILTRAHDQCQHGGRDKTSAEVRKIYSWVPKELISRFVKMCPTCRVRRGRDPRGSPYSSPRQPAPLYSPPHTPELPCPASRRQSLLSRHSSMLSSSPVSINMQGSQDRGNQWLPSGHYVDIPGPVHPRPSDATMASPSAPNNDSTGLSLNYASSRFGNENVGCGRAYPVLYDAPRDYPNRHHS